MLLNTQFLRSPVCVRFNLSFVLVFVCTSVLSTKKNENLKRKQQKSEANITRTRMNMERHILYTVHADWQYLVYANVLEVYDSRYIYLCASV